MAGHAHNDYIELLSDGGITACFVILWFILIFVFRTVLSFRKRRETYSIYIFIASVTGILSLAMHSLTDFNLHIGAKLPLSLFRPRSFSGKYKNEGRN